MPYTQYTLADLQGLLEELWQGSAFWTPEEARLALNETFQWWNLLTGYWKRRVVLPTVAGQVYYSLPSTLTYNMRFEVTSRPLASTSLAELDAWRDTWENETTASGGDVPDRIDCWAPVGLTQFAIWPADATAANSIAIDGIAATPELVLSTDLVDFGSAEFQPLLDLALHISAFKDPPLWASTLPAWPAFLQAAADQNERLLASSAFRQLLGLDRRRDLKPFRGRPEVNPALAQGQEGGG